MHVMIDLETCGIGPTAAIIQIGAQTFSFEEVDLSGRFFERAITLQSALMSGGTIDQSTIDWWKTQPAHIIREMSREAKELGDVLVEFTTWFPDDEVVDGVWAHGAAFDFPILEGAYKRLGAAAPWHYRKVRDTRTLFWLAAERGWYSEGAPLTHTALSDCRDQIYDLKSAYKFIIDHTSTKLPDVG